MFCCVSTCIRCISKDKSGFCLVAFKILFCLHNYHITSRDVLDYFPHNRQTYLHQWWTPPAGCPWTCVSGRPSLRHRLRHPSPSPCLQTGSSSSPQSHGGPCLNLVLKETPWRKNVFHLTILKTERIFNANVSLIVFKIAFSLTKCPMRSLALEGTQIGGLTGQDAIILDTMKILFHDIWLKSTITEHVFWLSCNWLSSTHRRTPAGLCSLWRCRASRTS